MNPFRLEEQRALYAENKNISAFRKLYSRYTPSILNMNTGLLWDGLNFSLLGDLEESPIYKDKVLQVLRLLKNRKGKLLDVGFGAGYVESKLSKGQLELYGIDISGKSLMEVKKRVRGIFKKANLLKIPFKTGFFDYVLCLDVLEHISPKDTFRALREVNRVMKRNSTLIISIPLNESLEEMINEKNVNPNAHVRVYTPNVLKLELALCGFNVKWESFLTAFSRHYFIKKVINNFLCIRKPNLLIFVAYKR